MKFADDNRATRAATDRNCYNRGVWGHFARECRNRPFINTPPGGRGSQEASPINSRGLTGRN